MKTIKGTDDSVASPEERKKFLAEARAADAGTRRVDILTGLERVKLLAEIEKVNAEGRRIAADALQSACYAEEQKLTLEHKKKLYEEMMASNRFHYVYDFVDSINELSIATCITQLRAWDRIKPESEIEIIFDSPGGSVTEGMHLFDLIQILRRSGHKITTGCLGMAASMGGILLQSGERRWMGAESYVLIHQIASGIRGKVGEIEDEMVFLKKMGSRILDIFAERCKQAGRRGTAKKPFTRKQLEEGWERRDWWLDSTECLLGGIVDEVR